MVTVARALLRRNTLLLKSRAFMAKPPLILTVVEDFIRTIMIWFSLFAFRTPARAENYFVIRISGSVFLIGQDTSPPTLVVDDSAPHV